MGCLFELIFEILFEGILELTVYGYMALMTWIVPDKAITDNTKEKLQNVIKIFAVVLIILIIIGLLLLLPNNPFMRIIAKCLIYIPLIIIALQIVLGIIVKLVNFLKKDR